MAKKFDLTSDMSAFMTDSENRAGDRFAHAAAVLQTQPSGTSAALGKSLESTSPQKEDFAQAHSVGRAGASIFAPISHVHDNPFNARRFYDPDTLKERAASLAKDGQMTPAPAVRHPERPGHYILLGGHYRKRGLLAIGKADIELKLLEAPTDLDMYRLSYAENDQRADATPMDDAFAWNELIEKNIVGSHEDIAQVTGKPRTTISKTISLLKLPPTVLEVLKEHPRQFSLTAGYLLTLLAEKVPVAMLEKHARAVAAGDMSTRQLESLKAKLSEAAAPLTREVSRQHKIVHEGAEIGVIKDWDSGKVTFEASITDPKAREHIVAKLQELIAGEVDRAKGNTSP